MKHYRKFENAKSVSSEKEKTFGIEPPLRQTIYKILDKFETTGSVNNRNQFDRTNKDIALLVVEDLKKSDAKTWFELAEVATANSYEVY